MGFNLRLLAFAGILVAGSLASAGTIYTSRSEFDAALSGLTPFWTEDFESFSLGSVSVPTSIGQGLAEIAKLGTAEIVSSGATLPPSGDKEWLGVESALGETIRGPGGTSLGVGAIGFDYFSAFAGSYTFNHSLGLDSDSFATGFQARFVGWIGDPGEVLGFVRYEPIDSGHILDDFAAYAVPGPASLVMIPLFVIGLRPHRRRSPESR